MLFNPILQIAVESWGAIICSLFAIIIFISTDLRGDKREFHLMMMVCQIAAILVCDSLAIYFRGDLSTLGYYMVRISNYLCFCLNCIIEVTAGNLLHSIIGDNDKSFIPHWLTISYIICGIQVVSVTINHFTGFVYYFDHLNCYHRGPWSFLNIACTGLLVILLLYVLLSNYKEIRSLQTNSLLFLFISTIVAEVFQFLFYGISLVYIGLAAGMMILLLCYQRENVLKLMETERKLMENKLLVLQHQQELADKRAKLMLSQIQPHFIFNTLAAISTLCVFDPEVAKSTTDNFATYLRRNLDSMGESQLIPFQQELEHVKAYLAIEKIRFEDELQVEYDIQFEHFMLPPLTIQPMVENAVRHGIRGKEDGGTVKLHTSVDDAAVHIIIQDDGIGFDINSKPDDGKSHVGIENVRERIKMICNGTMTINSEIGVGTKIAIDIPL